MLATNGNVDGRDNVFRSIVGRFLAGLPVFFIDDVKNTHDVLAHH